MGFGKYESEGGQVQVCVHELPHFSDVGLGTRMWEVQKASRVLNLYPHIHIGHSDVHTFSAWAPWHVASRPSTYSQNSMTGEVKFSEWVTALAPEWFRKSTQCSVGDKVWYISVKIGREVLLTLWPCDQSFPAIPRPKNFPWIPHFPQGRVGC